MGWVGTPPHPRLAAGISHWRAVPPTAAALVELGAALEAADVDEVVVSDHVVLGRDRTGHPGGVDFPFPTEEPYPEPLVLLSVLAGVTRRVELSTGLLVAPLRSATVLAKSVATLDVLSQGRVVLGLATGWHRPEFAACGVDVGQRVQRLEDTVRACRALWERDDAALSAPTVAFDGVTCRPRPDRYVPILLGGPATRVVTDRIARLADGWHPLGGTSPEEVARGVTLLREAYERRGRDPDRVRVRVALTLPREGTPAERLAAVDEAADTMVGAGATTLQVPMASLGDSVAEAVDALGTWWADRSSRSVVA